MSNADAKALFDRLFPGETVSPEDIAAHRAELEAAGFTLGLNAAGKPTDLQLPSGDWVDPIYGAGAGINRKQWNIESGGGAGGDQLAALQRAPGYQFRLGESLKALERSAANRGTLLTGGTLKALSRFAQDYASNEYDKRAQQLQGVAGMGYNAVGQQAGLGSAYGAQAGGLLGQQAQGVGDLLTQQGNAAAQGTVSAADAWQQGLGGAANALQMYYLSRLMQSAGRTGTASPYGPYAGGYQYPPMG